MSGHLRLGLLMLTALILLGGCAESTDPAGSPAPAVASEAPAPAKPADRRELAERALADQRIYAPAGDSAIEHFLALRDAAGPDPALETALLELLPYAVIGSEQAVARNDLPEAERLLALIERIDASAPSLARLKTQVANAEAAFAERTIAEAEAEKQRALEAQREAEIAAVAVPAGVPTTPAGAPPTATGPAIAPATPTPPPPALAEAAAVVPEPAPVTAPAQATPAAPDPVATRSRATPALISAPAPRYPFSALRRKIEGDVTVAFTIQPDGSVASPRVVATTSPGLFDQAALAAASRWRFETTPVPVEVTRELRFRLDPSQK